MLSSPAPSSIIAMLLLYASNYIRCITKLKLIQGKVGRKETVSEVRKCRLSVLIRKKDRRKDVVTSNDCVSPVEQLHITGYWLVTGWPKDVFSVFS